MLTFFMLKEKKQEVWWPALLCGYGMCLLVYSLVVPFGWSPRRLRVALLRVEIALVVAEVPLYARLEAHGGGDSDLVIWLHLGVGDLTH